MYIKTAPNTVPATALPFLGSSSPPITVWLCPCNCVLVLIQFHIRIIRICAKDMDVRRRHR
jgi:hypothetical protein